jgi:hypothetical protein
MTVNLADLNARVQALVRRYRPQETCSVVEIKVWSHFHGPETVTKVDFIVWDGRHQHVASTVAGVWAEVERCLMGTTPPEPPVAVAALTEVEIP